MELLLAASDATFLEMLLDNILALTILFIFAAAILGAFLRSRTRDNCLRDFHGYQVSLETGAAPAREGSLRLFSSGFELVHPDDPDTPETSTLVYESEYKGLGALHRYHDRLTPANQQKRLRQIERSHNPSLARRTARKFRNFFNIIRDAVVQSLEAFFGSAKKASPLMNSQGGQISGMGRGLIGHFGNAYDPILERFIGKRVIVEVSLGETATKYPGILKEYTDQFLEILSVPADRDSDMILPRVRAVVRHAGKDS